MTRYASFRFDDGFLAGARTASELLGPDRGTFFIVTGLVERTHRLDHIPLFVGREFGTIDDWIALARSGHDIQPHSVTHAHLPLLTLEGQIEEVERSLMSIKKIHDGPYIFCHPYNELTDLNFADLGFSAAGFSPLGSKETVPYNDLNRLNPYRLLSSAPPENKSDWIIERLRSRVPDGAWVILGFHSFDGEGAKPWSSAGFSRLVAEVRRLNFQVRTIGSMISMINNHK
jgi:peptidoglycan/xylan/chitin deacetylase (PgdA/CDA1 family)